MRIRCPACREWTTWTENPNRPFCSDRCRLSDLSAWASESYRIENREEEEEDENNGTETGQDQE